MKRKHNRKGQSWRWRVLLGIAAVLLAGVIGEAAFNLPLFLNPKQQGTYEKPFSQLETEGFQAEGNKLQAVGKRPLIEVRTDGFYVDKFYYRYQSQGPLAADIYVYGEKDGKEVLLKKIADNNSLLYRQSVVTVREKAERIVLRLKDGTDGAAITEVGIRNLPQFSLVRFLFVSCCAFIIWLLLFFGALVRDKLEYVFLLIALFTGILMILGVPVHRVGWDEEIHFYRAYSLAYELAGEDTMPASYEMYTYMRGCEEQNPYRYAQSSQEAKVNYRYGEEGRPYSLEDAKPDEFQKTEGFHLYSIGYLTQALFLEIGFLLKMPFGALYIFGKLGNLLLYCIVTFFAIRHMKRGKVILTVVALFPTSILLASVYAYDAFINAFFFLGISYLVTELAETDRNISYKNVVVFMLAFVIGSLPKAVYIPLILLGFLLPARRFKNPKAAWAFKGGMLILCLLLMATFVFPTASNPPMEGDARGGDTSVSKQLALVLAHPFAYVGSMLRQVGDSFILYVFRHQTIANFAYRGITALSPLVPAFVIGVILTDTQAGSQRKLTLLHKAFTAVMILGTIALVWTALYLSFTPVGQAKIAGVQARYYLPFLPLLYLILNPSFYKLKIPTRVYHSVVILCSSVLLMEGVFEKFIVNCF